MFLPSEIFARDVVDAACSTVRLPAVLRRRSSSASRIGTPERDQRAQRAGEARHRDLAHHAAR